MIDFGEKLKKLRKKLGMTQAELAEKTGMSKGNVSKYEKGLIKDIPISVLEKFSMALNVDPIEFMEWNNLVRTLDISDTQYAYINVYGTVPAGIPVEAVEDVIGKIEIPVSMFHHGKDYIALKVKGYSMYPRYLEDDIVIIELTSDFTSGQDVVVYVNGYEATLKTIYKNDDGTITLKPVNPEYREMTYGPGDDEVRVLGIVRRLMRDV